MSKYTPGEWSIASHSATYQVIGEGAEKLRKLGLPTQFYALSVGTAHGQVAIVPLDESSIDNAALITAAPKLLEALRSILEIPTGDSTGVVNHENNWTRWAKRTAALAVAKAEVRP